ncbi:RNA polymerase sigma factor, partial [Kitasatospora indigofera]|uniref:RNA polymerase sigma factor n=1 Tax=Kitasatospora indigofera TaxID=67307 RepID=UPI0033AF9EF1
MARADRPDLTSGAAGGPPSAEAARRAVEAVWRIESARIVGALARYTGDFALAEDVAQEALAEALVTWSRDGAPASPVGWLLATARRRAIDGFRRKSALDERYAMLAGQLTEGGFSSGAVTAPGRPDDLPWDPDRVDDDVLALMFTACHPVLAPEARVALTLRVVGGLSSEEIARAFLVPVPTVQARITRAKKTLAAAHVPFELPPAEERPARLGGVLSVLYVIFTEGSTATTGDRLLRPDLAYEAVRLARMLTALLPAEPEVSGLLALFELTAARFPARTGPDGEAVLLEDQDRRLWDRSAIRRGLAAIGRATALGRGLGPYGLQAAIAACHATAPSVQETDWEHVVLLYEALGRVAPSPVVELNRAVAVAM